MIVASGSANQPLARAICDQLEIQLCKVYLRRFDDGEIFVEIKENVRGEDVFVFQPTSVPANDHLMELLIMIDALRRSSAGRITAVIPYYGYARQDRKTTSRSPISAKLVANLIETAGADRVLTLDLHAGQIQGFFDIPTDNLYASPLFARDIATRNADLSDLMMVSPDVGGVGRTRSVAKRLNLDLAIIDKRRPEAGLAEVMNVIGKVHGKRCLIIDDICDSGGTLARAAEALLAQGAATVSAYISHGVFSGNAVKNLVDAPLEELVVTDSILMRDDIKAIPQVRTMSIAGLMSEAISRIAHNQSVSSLFI